MANNPNQRKESYHEVPASKYIFLFNTAVHKRFFAAWTLFLLIALQAVLAIVLGPEVLWNFHLTVQLSHWIIIPAEALAASAAGVILWYRHAKRQKLTREHERLTQLRREANTDTVDTRGG